MKKNRLTALILTFVLLFGCLSVLPAFAEEAAADGQVAIVAQNVVYSEKIQIAFAVDYDTATAAQDVKVAYTVDGETKLAAYWGVETINEVDYPVFVTDGFHANEFTKQVSTVAYTGEEAPADATPKLYSVGQYFYSMLYKHNFIDKTTGEDAARKDLYLSAIEFGTNAQRVLDDATGNALLNQYCFVWAADDVYINGDYAALVPAGTELTLVREGATKYQITIDGNVSDLDGNTYTAEAGVQALITGVGGGVTDTYETMTYDNGTSSSYVKSYDADGVEITGNYSQGSSLSMGLANEAGNNFLQVRNPANSGKSGKTEVQLSNTVQTGNCYTFETKINIAGATGGYNFAKLKFVNNNNGEAVNLYLKATNNASSKANFAIATTGSNSNFSAGTVLFDYNDKSLGTGVWFTVRVELYFVGAPDASAENTYMKLYVDEVLAYDGLAHWATGANISHVELEHVSAGKVSNICYDDIYFTRTDKAYVEGN